VKIKLITFIITIVIYIFSVTPINYAMEQVVMATGEWRPFTSQKMEHYGFFTEIVSAVLKKMGKKPKYNFVPWKRCERQLEVGKVWGVFPYSPTAERKKKYVFSDNIIFAKSVFFYCQEKMKNIKWEKLEDLQPYNIGGVLGSFYQKEFEDAKLKVKYDYSASLALNTLFIRRYTHLLPMNEFVGWDIIKNNFPDKIKNFGILKQFHSKDPLCIMILKNDDKSLMLLEKFNNSLKKINQDPIYKKILNKYKFTVHKKI